MAFQEKPASAEPSLEQTVAIMRRVLVEKFGVHDPQLPDDAEISTLGLDSLNFVEYAFELETALHVKFDDVPRDVATIGDFVRFVHGEVIRQDSGQPAH